MLAIVNALPISLVALLATLALIGFCTWMLARRAAGANEVRVAVDRELDDVLNRDQQGLQTFVDSVLQGTSFEQALQRYLSSRAALLPGANRESPPHWTAEQLEAVRRRRTAAEIEGLNQRFLVPSVAGALAIIAAALVTCGVLYEFASDADDSHPPLLDGLPAAIVLPEHLNDPPESESQQPTAADGSAVLPTIAPTRPTDSQDSATPLVPEEGVSSGGAEPPPPPIQAPPSVSDPEGLEP